MKRYLTSLSIAVALLVSQGAFAAESDRVEVKWSHPEKYSDIEPANETKNRFQQRFFSEMERQFAKLAEKLPEGDRWQIEVTDVDLAGRVNYHPRMASSEIRVINDWFTPKLVFSFKILDSKGNVVLAKDDCELKESMIARFPSHKFMNREFSYEQYLVKRWFEKELLPEVTKLQNKGGD